MRNEVARNPNIATQVREILDVEFSRQLTADCLARRLRCNRTQLQAEFKVAFSVTIHQYVIRRRIEAAKQLLANTAWKIDAVSSEVGYRSRDAFYTNFRTVVGIAPNEYRRAKRVVTRTDQLLDPDMPCKVRTSISLTPTQDLLLSASPRWLDRPK
jgi:AraC-like DNA-binding protein